jgi:hypothetical protein
MDALDRDGRHYRRRVQRFSCPAAHRSVQRLLNTMRALARPLFFAAWVCPTITLLFGELPVVRIIAAVLAAMLSGAAISTLPPAASASRGSSLA